MPGAATYRALWRAYRLKGLVGKRGGPIDVVSACEAAGKGYLDCSVNVISHFFSARLSVGASSDNA